jgi:hypothetical protein
MHSLASLSNTTTSRVRRMASQWRNASPAGNTSVDLCYGQGHPACHQQGQRHGGQQQHGASHHPSFLFAYVPVRKAADASGRNRIVHTGHTIPSSPHDPRGSKRGTAGCTTDSPRTHRCPPSPRRGSEPLTADGRHLTKIVRYGTSPKRRNFAVTCSC